MSVEESSLLELEKGSDVDQTHAPQTRKPRVLLMLVGAVTVLLCFMSWRPALQAAHIPAMVGLARKPTPPFSDPGIKLDNPEEYYDFGDELYRDMFTITKVVTKKDTGDQYLAEIFIFQDKDNAKIAKRVYDLRTKTLAGVKGVPELIEAYMVQHNLITISPYIETKPVLEWMAARTPITDGDVAKLMVSIIEAVTEFHAKGIVHANINPWSVRVSEGGDIFFTSLTSAKKTKTAKVGEVMDIMGDTEYVSPEGLEFDPVLWASDVWSLAVLADTLLTGVSPFYDEDEDKVVDQITKKGRVTYGSLEDVGASPKVVEAVKRGMTRAPENRPTTDDKNLELWQACESETTELDIKVQLLETNARLQGELGEEAVSSCGPFRTFDEDEEDCEEEEED